MAEGNTALASKELKPNSDETVLIHAARKDPKAFGGLYKLYVEQVFRYLVSQTGNVQEAEDITAQTFLAAFESFRRFRQEGHFASWLFAIARNKAMDYFRQRKIVAPIDDANEIPVESNPLSGMIRSEQSVELGKLIQALPEDERELLRLRYLAELSFPEIARLLHRNEDAVKKSTYRLLARLHSQLEASNG
jgi:RNA polymerase sigma-70 factor (ECF subfamily)